MSTVHCQAVVRYGKMQYKTIGFFEIIHSQQCKMNEFCMQKNEMLRNVLVCLHQVHEDYDCMLNQTNIGHNNNKFYVIQVIKANNTFYSWNRWGRVVSLFNVRKHLLTLISFNHPL